MPAWDFQTDDTYADRPGLSPAVAALRSAGLVRVRMSGNGDMHYSLRSDLIPDTTALLREYLAQ